MSKDLTVGPSRDLPDDMGGGRALAEPAAQALGLGAPGAGDGEEGMDWRRYWSALRRYKWWVMLAAIVGTGLGFVASRFSKAIYSAQATVWIEARDEKGNAERGPIRQGQLLDSYGWVELLNSFVVLDHAVERVKLYLQFESAGDSTLFKEFALAKSFAPGSYRLAVDDAGSSVTLSTAVGTLIERASPGDSLGRKIGFHWAPSPTDLAPGQVVDFTVVTPRDAARGLAEQLLITPAVDGNFVRVELEGPNPVLIAATVNALVERYEDVAAELKREKLTELANILNEQLQQSEENLRRAELALESFRVQTITLPTERATPMAPGVVYTTDPVMDNFFQMKVAREQLVRDRDAIVRALESGLGGRLSTDALEVIGEIQRSSVISEALGELMERQAELRALRYRYTDEHPTVSRLANEVIDLESVVIPGLLRALVNDLDGRRNELDSMIESAGRELQQIPPRAIREARLTRDKIVAEDLHTQLKQRYESARLAEASSIPDLRILDPAVVPQRPVRYRGQTYILIGLLGGFAMGIIGVIVADKVDGRVRYPAQITSDLGLSLLGVVPRLRGAGNGADSDDAVAVIEALRGVRLNLIHARGAGGPFAVTVSSPAAGDGKTFVSSNLALAFAEAGHRTLLIDGDSRRGTLHRAVNGKRKPGLTDFLGGEATVEEIVQKTEYSALHFVGCGTRTSEAPELLSSAAMARFMASMRNSYGVIIVDSPPLSAGIDAYALSTLTGNLAVVLRLGATNRELAEAKLEAVDRLPIRVLGAILNDVRESTAYSYYRYYSNYLPGYEHEDEEDEDSEDRHLLGRAG